MVIETIHLNLFQKIEEVFTFFDATTLSESNNQFFEDYNQKLCGYFEKFSSDVETLKYSEETYLIDVIGVITKRIKIIKDRLDNYLNTFISSNFPTISKKKNPTGLVKQIVEKGKNPYLMLWLTIEKVLKKLDEIEKLIDDLLRIKKNGTEPASNSTNDLSSRKLDVNLSKVNLVVIFLMLSEAGIIKPKNQKFIKDFIESNFKCLNKSGKHLDIKNIGPEISRFFSPQNHSSVMSSKDALIDEIKERINIWVDYHFGGNIKDVKRLS